MTRERFEQIKAAALEMAGEIEWADYPTLTGDYFRGVLAVLLEDYRFCISVQEVLTAMFRVLESAFERMPDHQEVELDAAGLVQAALKHVLNALFPEGRDLWSLPLRTKFRRLPVAVIQAPPGVYVPSMAEQLGTAGPVQ